MSQPADPHRVDEPHYVLAIYRLLQFRIVPYSSPSFSGPNIFLEFFFQRLLNYNEIITKNLKKERTIVY